MKYYVTQFIDGYYFLSKHYSCSFEENGIVFTCLVNYMEYHRCKNEEDRKLLIGEEGFSSLYIASDFESREDWEDVKLMCAFNGLRLKFKDPELREMLKATKDCYIEYIDCESQYWGTWNNKGENVMGRLLMIVRNECLEQDGDESSLIDE